ncbi:peptidoglycan-binding protein [Mumia zhuanghuii]|uniref:Peptidoglycan-binding protein n=2 Tax=Mumia TaxID=1546255 RepID=A0ABW1QLA4_9ACTN|nr:MULTISPECIES: peptidoglycan-binding protein [Mumia]KAA1425050.1 peptidoglycan-binding protein [Mumia zhuanghuii]
MSRTHLGRTASLLLAPTVLTLALAAPSAAKAPPSPVALSTIELPAPHIGPVSCAKPQPGTVKLGNLLVKTWPVTSWMGARDCGSSSSEHYDGRAVDWMTNARTAKGKKRGNDLAAWLLATDAAGNRFANARRLGVMYIIWNNRIWSTSRSREGWRVYNGCTAKGRSGTGSDTTCHRNHVHLSLSWAGARGYTSYWDGTVAGANYGPCRPADLNWAGRYTKRRATPCPWYPRVTAPRGSSAVHRSVVAYSGLRITKGMRGPAVRAVQHALRIPVTGVWDASSRARMRSYKGARHLGGSAVVGAATWRSLIALTAPKPKVPTT